MEFYQFDLLFPSDRTAPHYLIDTAPTIIFNWIFPTERWALSVLLSESGRSTSKTMSILEAPEGVVATNFEILSAILLCVKPISSTGRQVPFHQSQRQLVLELH